MSGNPDDGFRVVKSKRNSRVKVPTSLSTNHQDVIDSSPDYVQELYQKVEKCKKRLRDDDDGLYWRKVQLDLHMVLKDEQAIEVICFGLGSIDDSLSSRYQLALLQLVIEGLPVGKLSFFDPVFNAADKKLLAESYKFNLLDANSQCMHRVSKTTTIFYMPHCGKALYNNLLYSNWSPSCLSKLVILGNDFRTIESLSSDDQMIKRYSYIKDSLKLLTCHKTETECTVTNAFEDLCIQHFEPNNLDKKKNDRVNHLIDEAQLDSLDLLETKFRLLSCPSYEESEEILK